MTREHKISIGGNVGGHVVTGNLNVVGGPDPAPAPQLAAPEADAESGSGLRPRLGFVVDVIGYGRRLPEQRTDLHQRLSMLIGHLLADVGYSFEATDNDGGSGDGMAVFLPVGADYTRAMPGLLAATRARLAKDNGRYRDRMRLRMAIDTGLLGPPGPTGLTGDLIVDLKRLVDSEELRKAVCDHPGSDLLVLVGNAVHHDVVRPGYVDDASFRRVDVATKEYRAPAWLWIG